MSSTKGLLFLLLAVFSSYGVDSDSPCQYRRDQIVPKLIYSQLKCTPKHGEDNCIEEYECPHVNRPKDTCFFKGKTIQIDETIDEADLRDIWAHGCSCTKSLDFDCPEVTDGCAEGWVGNYPKPGCYLRRELNSLCAAGEICPPFEGNAECRVENKIYKEGEQFQHPKDHRQQCVCNKGFNLEAPFCQTVNCTETLLKDSKKIDQFCAPFYSIGDKRICPETWICPKETDQHFPDPVRRKTPTLNCKFGTKDILLGDYLIQKDPELGDVTCECLLPPYLYCTAYPKDNRVYN